MKINVKYNYKEKKRIRTYFSMSLFVFIFSNYTINELENSEFPLHAVHWYFPYSDITITITKNQLNNFIKDIKQLTEELDLLNLYREFKPDEGQFPDNYQFIAK